MACHLAWAWPLAFGWLPSSPCCCGFSISIMAADLIQWDSYSNSFTCAAINMNSSSALHIILHCAFSEKMSIVFQFYFRHSFNSMTTSHVSRWWLHDLAARESTVFRFIVQIAHFPFAFSFLKDISAVSIVVLLHLLGRSVFAVTTDEAGSLSSEYKHRQECYSWKCL